MRSGGEAMKELELTRALYLFLAERCASRMGEE